MQPSADSLHLGNYLGALVNWVTSQDENDCYFFLADLHALTETPEPEQLRRRTRESGAELLAMGVDAVYSDHVARMVATVAEWTV
jgi:tryptophanyl-tRNA synthetase